MTNAVSSFRIVSDHSGQLRKGRITIFQKFESLEAQKQADILNAALQEFAQNGYDKASTNEIVKTAGISKGSLFNYFANKKALYNYLFNYGMAMTRHLYEEIDIKERDIFTRIANTGIQKLKMHKQNPYLFDFLISAQEEASPEVIDIIGDKIIQLNQDGLQKIYENIDFSMFREDVDLEKAIEILNWVMYGFSEKQIRQLGSFKDSLALGEFVFQEWDVYAAILRKTFYKEGV